MPLSYTSNCVPTVGNSSLSNGSNRTSSRIGHSYFRYVPSDTSFYIQGALPQPSSHPAPAVNSNPGPIKKSSCSKRICKSVCKFFIRRKKRDDDYEQEQQLIYRKSIPPPGTFCFPSQSFVPLPVNVHPVVGTVCRSREFQVERKTVGASQYSLVDYNSQVCENVCNTESDDDDEGEYIIYIPRASKTKLERNYLKPLRNSCYTPVIIRPTTSSGRISSRISVQS